MGKPKQSIWVKHNYDKRLSKIYFVSIFSNKNIYKSLLLNNFYNTLNYITQFYTVYILERKISLNVYKECRFDIKYDQIDFYRNLKN